MRSCNLSKCVCDFAGLKLHWMKFWKQQGFPWWASSEHHPLCCIRHMDINCLSQTEQRNSNQMIKISVCVCVCRISNIQRLGTVGVNYTENNVGTGDSARTLCWVCQERSGSEITVVPLWTSGQILCQYEASGKLEPIISFSPKAS